jgi:hypothetical protein
VFTAPLAGQMQRSTATDVQVAMRGVDFHVDSAIVLRIGYLRGALRRTSPDKPPYFDDKHSFTLQIDTARIGISPAHLSALLNRYVFAYPGAPIHRLNLTVDHGQLVQRGTLKGISFKVVGDLTVTLSGELRLHPSTIKAVGIPVGGLMDLFGIQLQKLVNLRQARGVRLEKNDFILNPAELLPPPTARGMLSAVEVSDTAIVQIFKSPPGEAAKPLTPPDAKARNFMYYRGSVLRFGKLTMNDTDLEIIDGDPRDPFDFFLDRYNLQLTAGYSRNTPSHGLIVFMPDFRQAQAVRDRGGLRPAAPIGPAASVHDSSATKDKRGAG